MCAAARVRVKLGLSQEGCKRPGICNQVPGSHFGQIPLVFNTKSQQGAEQEKASAAGRAGVLQGTPIPGQPATGAAALWGCVNLRAQQKQQDPAWSGLSRWTSKHDGCFNVQSLERIFLPYRRQTQRGPVTCSQSQVSRWGHDQKLPSEFGPSCGPGTQFSAREAPANMTAHW